MNPLQLFLLGVVVSVSARMFEKASESSHQTKGVIDFFKFIGGLSIVTILAAAIWAIFYYL